jgi:CRISPR-associated protein Cas1
MINAIPSGGSRQILLSKRANIFYLDQVKVFVRHERVIYQIVKGPNALDYNLPDCNTALLLLGKGSSITDAAIRALAKSGVIVGFAGSGGSPLHSVVDYVFLNPADEYRPTEYCQQWVKMWFLADERFQRAKLMQQWRIEFTLKAWTQNEFLQKKVIQCPEALVGTFRDKINEVSDENKLMLAEALWTKGLYAALSKNLNLAFKREHGLAVPGDTNSFLDHGNYLMYGLASVALHALGIPAAFPLLHGKTRRGALVFDVADLFKDAHVLPLAFEAGYEAWSDQQFRSSLIQKLQKEEILDHMINSIKKLI